MLKFFTVAVFAIAFSLTACDNTNQSNLRENKNNMSSNFTEKLSAEIQNRVDNENSSPFDMKSLTGFKWDKLFIFTPYTPFLLISEKIGNDADKLKYVNMDAREEINLLVFLKDGKIVEFVEFPRKKGDFDKVENPDGFDTNSAKFIVKVEDRGEPWITVLEKK